MKVTKLLKRLKVIQDGTRKITLAIIRTVSSLIFR